MSRIEEALARALDNRQSDSGTGSPAAPAPAGAPQPESGRSAGHDTGDRRAASMPPPPPDIVLPPLGNQLLVTANAPDSFMAEEYRKLKEVLISKTRTRDSFRNTIMITSALMGEGKTLTSLNLAISLAQEHDHTVLLVDADLRRPSCARYLGLENTTGLSEYLNEGLDLSKLLIKTGIGKLVFLPAGTPTNNPGELFSSQRMRDLIVELKHRYKDRYIIIDTPPVLPFAETRTVGSIADGVVLVVREGHTSLDNVKDAMEALRNSDILGVLYNNAEVKMTLSNYSYYSYYKHYRRR